mmetsp:Transcript_21807/g.45444  ORF Transcript_21807/g.45444 Transcript_21807/m.45444 type:complete len:378 (+) Transcript_21807:191-1324(+)
MSSWSDSMPPGIVGVLGFTMFLILSFIVFYRLLYHLKHGSNGLFTLRKTFHLSLFIYVALESISYIPMSFLSLDQYSPVYYACHLLAVSFDITAFSLVTVLWSRTVLNVNNRRYRWIYGLVGGVDIGFFISSCCVINDMLTNTSSSSDLNAWASSSPSYANLLILEPCTLTFNALCVIVYGSRMLYKLVSLRNWGALPRKVQVRILTQTFFTMFSCAFCYLLRSFLLFLEYRKIKVSDSLMPTNWLWWVGAIWIPQIVPSGLLLFTMRNLDKKRQRKERGGDRGGRFEGVVRGDGSGERTRRLNSLPQDDDSGMGSGFLAGSGRKQKKGVVGGLISVDGDDGATDSLEKSLIANDYKDDEEWGNNEGESIRSNSITF